LGGGGGGVTNYLSLLVNLTDAGGFFHLLLNYLQTYTFKQLFILIIYVSLTEKIMDIITTQVGSLALPAASVQE
jgi:hypothetical protein